MKKMLVYIMLLFAPLFFTSCRWKTTIKFDKNTWDYDFIRVTQGDSLMMRELDEEALEGLFTILSEATFEEEKESGNWNPWMYRIQVFTDLNNMFSLDIISEKEIEYRGEPYRLKEGSLSLDYFEQLFCVESTYDTVNQGNEISMKTEQEIYDQYTDSIHLILTNHSDYEASFGMEFRLEILEEEKWYQVFPKEIQGWNDIAMLLQGNTEAETKISLDSYHGKLEEGHYRLVKEVYLYQEGVTKTCIVAAEFDIEQGGKPDVKVIRPSTLTPDTSDVKYYKPVIYLYPEQQTEVNVELELNGSLFVSYPDYPKNGWNVTAYPDGTIINLDDGLEYSYLFWEADMEASYDMSKGFVVEGKDTKEFLQKTLSYLGLTPREYNEFIVYWLPQMKEHPFNLITFQTEAYANTAKLKVTPEPDSILRVFMAYQPLNEGIELPEQKLESFKREGFSVIEWGGTELKPTK